MPRDLIKKHKKTRLKKIFALLLLVGVLGALGFWYYRANDTQGQNTSEAPGDGTSETVNLNPPTEDEQLAGDQQKDQSAQDGGGQQDTENSDNQTASVIITDAGQYGDVIEVRAFIPNHYEDGTCTITFTKDSLQVTKEAPAYRDSSTTICTNPLIKRSEFTATGDWQLKVTYKSAGASGSASQTVTIN